MQIEQSAGVLQVVDPDVVQPRWGGRSGPDGVLLPPRCPGTWTPVGPVGRSSWCPDSRRGSRSDLGVAIAGPSATEMGGNRGPASRGVGAQPRLIRKVGPHRRTAHESDGSSVIQPRAISSRRARLTPRRSAPKARAIQAALTRPRPSNPARRRDRQRRRMPSVVAMRAGRRRGTGGGACGGGWRSGRCPGRWCREGHRSSESPWSGNAMDDPPHSMSPAAWSRPREAPARLREMPRSPASSSMA